MIPTIFGPLWCPNRQCEVRFTQSKQGYIWAEYRKSSTDCWHQDKAAFWHLIESEDPFFAKLITCCLQDNNLYVCTGEKNSLTGILIVSQFAGRDNWVNYVPQEGQFLPFKGEEFDRIHWQRKTQPPEDYQVPTRPKTWLAPVLQRILSLLGSLVNFLMRFFGLEKKASPKENSFHREQNSLPSFDDLGNDMIRDVFLKMLPEELLQLTKLSINRRINKLLKDDDLWNCKLKQHFPMAAVDYFGSDHRFELFWQTYKEEYTVLEPCAWHPQARGYLIAPQQRELFSLAKEGDSRLIKKLPTDSSDPLWHFKIIPTRVNYRCSDKHYLTPLNWLAINKHQILFDQLYKNSSLQRALNYDKVSWAILCHRSLEEIQKIRGIKEISNACLYRPFLLAANFGQLEIINFLLTLNMPIKSSLEEMATTAIACGHIKLANLFLPYVGTFFVLRQACRYQQWEIVKQLNLSLNFLATINPTYYYQVKYFGQYVWNAMKANQLEVVKKLCLANLVEPDSPILDDILKNAKKPYSETFVWLKKFQSPHYNSLCQKAVMKLKNSSKTSLSEPLTKARALLSNYVRDNSATSRFFHGDWNRHHVAEVTCIIKRIDSKELNTKSNLMAALDEVEKKYKKKFNPFGSFARLKEFIREFIFAPIEKNLLAVPGGQNTEFPGNLPSGFL